MINEAKKTTINETSPDRIAPNFHNDRGMIFEKSQFGMNSEERKNISYRITLRI